MPLEGTVDVAIWLTLRSILLDTADLRPHPAEQRADPARSRSWRPRATLANPIFPAPTIARFCPGNQLADTVMKALAPAVPAAGQRRHRQSAGRSPSAGLQGEHALGAHGDLRGQLRRPPRRSTAWTRSTRSTPTPATTRSRTSRSHLPLRVERYELREDVLRAGRVARRPRLGARVHASSTTAAPRSRATATSFRPWGFLGGSDGLAGRARSCARGGRRRRGAAVQGAVHMGARGRPLRLRTGRAAAATAIPAGARPSACSTTCSTASSRPRSAARDYGVVITRDLVLDLDATARVRATA